MNKLEELHLNTHSHVAVTEQIAIEFAGFYVSYCNKYGQTHSEEVFQEFLKTLK